MTGASAALPGWRHVYSGKVRDLYLPEAHVGEFVDAQRALVVASDRVSAFDHVLAPGIPGKGALLTRLSRWWFSELAEFPHHLADPTATATVPPGLADRAMLVRPLAMFPIECVVRGYLTGSGWLEYRQRQSVCGIALPAGLTNGDRLPMPLYTPAYKAPAGEHDQNISFDASVELVGGEVAEALRALSLAIFARASARAEAAGLILADTKFEFGADQNDGTITLADEVLTSDSSRYWDLERYLAGGPERLESFDKQIVRNWLAANWDPASTTPPPRLPDDIVRLTVERYQQLVDRLTAAS